MSDPLVPNYKREVGRLATDRFDFEDHVEGLRFRHKADAIDVFPTLVIGTTHATNVQQALEALRDAAEPPVINDASTVTKGIVQLAGDIGGVATNVVVTRIQGKPISSLTPSDGNVLTWDGTAMVWHPAAPTNVFGAAGDLAGNNVLQNVIGWTGSQFNFSSPFVVRASNAVVDYVLGVTPVYTQDTASTTHGTDMAMRAQSTTGASKNGGASIIAGGAPGSGGLRGSVKLQLTNFVPGGYPITTLAGITSTNMVQLAEPATGRRVLSLCYPADLTTIDMPANTGDMVMYVRDTALVPTTGNPSNGTIVYSTGGQLWIKQQDGNNFSVGSIPNPSIWGPSGQQTYTNRNYVASAVGSAALAFSFNLPDQTATRADVIFIGKQVGGNNSAQFNLSMGYVRHFTAPTAVGTVTNADPRTTAGASGWTVPNVTVSGNTLQVFTGFSGSATVQWFVITQLTMSSSS
jgi:hypothetical protein